MNAQPRRLAKPAVPLAPHSTRRAKEHLNTILSSVFGDGDVEGVGCIGYPDGEGPSGRGRAGHGLCQGLPRAPQEEGRQILRGADHRRGETRLAPCSACLGEGLRRRACSLLQGTYAKVRYGQHVDTGEAVAIKILDKDHLVKTGMVEQIK